MEDSLGVLSTDNSKDDPQSIATICNPFNKSAENIIELPSWHTFRHLFGCRKGLLQVTDGFLQILTLLLLIHQFLCQRDHQQRDPKPLSCHSHRGGFFGHVTSKSWKAFDTPQKHYILMYFER